LSSSKGAKVLPTIDMAFSYGLGVSPIACRLFLLNEIWPSKKGYIDFIREHSEEEKIIISKNK